jgi:hypothetical protein
VGYHTLTFGPAVALGTNWYPWEFYGSGSQPAGYATQNADGSLAISGLENNNSGASVSTALVASSAQGWTGTAFGGGFYVEATLSFTGQGNGPYNNGGPAFWALDIEHTSQGSIYTNANANALPGPGIKSWPNFGRRYNAATTYEPSQGVSYKGAYYINLKASTGIAPVANTITANWAPNSMYNDFFEVDFMEYDGSEYIYQNGIGNWYGPNTGPGAGSSTSNPYEILRGGVGTVPVPVGTDFSQPHRYGCLWVPATPTTLGYLQFFFDGVQTASPTYYWKYNDPANPFPPVPVNGVGPPPNNSTAGTPGTAMSGMDTHHMILILGTGTDQPMTVQSVKVWQASAANNLVY